MAEITCPLCGAELNGDVRNSSDEARCLSCRSSLCCQPRMSGSVVVLDMIPELMFWCDLGQAVANWKAPLFGHPQIVVNLSRVERADSSFLAGLLLLKKKVVAAGGRLILCGPRAWLREMFVCTNLEELFVIVARESDAMRILQQGSPGRRAFEGSAAPALSE